MNSGIRFPTRSAYGGIGVDNGYVADICTCLSHNNITRKKYSKTIPAYEITHEGKDIVVACAAGHLYTVAGEGKKSWKKPVF